MRFIPSILLALLTLGLGTLVIVQQKYGNLDRIFGSPALGVGDRIYDFNPQDVGRIEILSHDGSRAILEKKGGAWIVERGWQDIADPRVIQELLSFSSNLIIEDIIDHDDVEDLAEFGLRGANIEIQMYDKGGRPLCHFNMGRNTAWRSVDQEGNSFPTVIIRPAERSRRDYLYVCGDRANPAIRTVGIRTLFDQELRFLRNHSVFYRPPHFAAEISLKNQNSEINSEIILNRDQLSKKSPWRLSTFESLAANAEAVQRLIAGLSTLKASAVLDESSEALLDPLPENLAQTISVKFFLPDGTISSPTSVFIYPPAKETDSTVSAVIATGQNFKRPAILKIPRADLAALPLSVNELRSRTLTSLEIAEVTNLKIAGPQKETLALSLEWDPHERAKRWHARVQDYVGAANEEQVKFLFEALFVDEILDFSDDAVTDLSLYGLDRPIRTIELTLKSGETQTFALGQAKKNHFYARNPKNNLIREISASTYKSLIEGQSSTELAPLLRNTPAKDDPNINLSLYGLNKPRKINVRTEGGSVPIELGESKRLHFYAHRVGIPRVTEVSARVLNKIALEDFKWRVTRLWSIAPFEIRGLVIKRRNRPPLQLSYNFFRQEWKAKQGTTDVTSRLNENKANRLLEKLAETRVHSWLGPVAEDASFQLMDPDLTISVIVNEVNESGESIALKPLNLKISQISRGVQNRFFYGSLSTDPYFFLLDVGTVKALAVELIE